MYQENAQTSLEIMATPTKQEMTCVTPLTSRDNIMNVSRSVSPIKALHLKPCIPLKDVQRQGLGFISESKIHGRPVQMEPLLSLPLELDQPRKKTRLPPRLQPRHLLEYIRQAGPLLDSPRVEVNLPEEPRTPARPSYSSRIIPFEACKSAPGMPDLPDSADIPQQENILSCRIQRRWRPSSCHDDRMLPPQKRVAYDAVAAQVF